MTLDNSNCYGNVFSAIPAAAGVPAPVLPTAGILDRDPVTLLPFSWSALAGVGGATGVRWDYAGAPMRVKPVAGCREIAEI